MYEAVVLVGGIEIAKGNLIVQKATTNTYSCGVVMNPYPIGFADTPLKDNDYGELGELGTSDGILLTMSANVEKMVINSLSADSNIKFAMFYSKEFYSDNPNFIRVVNYCFVKNNKLIAIDTSASYTNPAGITKYTLAPQIKFVYLLKCLLHSIGYKLNGSIENVQR